MFRFLLPLALCAVLVGVAAAQDVAESKDCGGHLRPEDLQKLIENEALGRYELLEPGGVAGDTVYTVAVTYHIVRRGDGTGGIDPAWVDDAIAKANALWSFIGIQFCRVGPIIYHDSDAFYDNVGTSISVTTLYQQDNAPSAIDLYFVGDLGPWCGYACFSWWDHYGIAFDNGCLDPAGSNGKLMAHELGHYFDLLHTFETATAVECPDGSNCSVAGDLVCDTPADPNRWSGCSLAAMTAEPDTCDDTPYAPDPTNLMSYASFACSFQFTPGQKARARATLLNIRDDELLGTPMACDANAACGAGPCYEAHDGTGCVNADCCTTVCDIDPFCCATSWDGVCADLAADVCAPCGETGAGSCFLDNGTPGCSNGSCCQIVCAADPFCCDTEWDGICRDAALAMCASCGDPGAGPCSMANATPGCSDSATCAAVCAVLPECCSGSWSASCVGIAIDLGFVTPAPNDECETATLIASTANVVLSDNTASTGDDSSCGTNDALDEWYRWIADCTGTAEAGLCTEFAFVQVTISVFDECGGTELACSTSDPDCPLGIGALASWSVEQGRVYLVRVSGENATPAQNVNGVLGIECIGCGASDSGDCGVDNGTPYCSDVDCCSAVCAADTFCCDVEWDSICAGTAATLCVQECGGPITGPCDEANGSPYCDDAACCDAVCAIDPFCCSTAWDGVCANLSRTACATVVGTFPFTPIGDAVLGVGPGDTLVISNVDEDPVLDDGAELIIELPPSLDGASVGLLPPGPAPANGGQVLLQAGLAPGVQPGVSGGSIGFAAGFGAVAGGAAELRVDFDYGNGVPYLHDVRYLLKGVVVASGASSDAALGTAAVEPDRFDARRLNGRHLRLSLGWAGGAQVTLPAALGGATIGVDAIEVISTSQTPPADSDLGADTPPRFPGLQGGLPGALLPGATDIESVRVVATGYPVISLDDIELLPSCFGDVDGDRLVGVGDLLAVLGGWGPVGIDPEPDVAPPGGDGEVGVSDLLQVLADWGPCP